MLNVRKKVISTVVLVTFLSSNSFASVYATLDYSNGRHSLDTLSNYGRYAKVDLDSPRTGIPYDTREVTCNIRWFANENQGCIPQDISKFRETTIDQPLMLPLLHVFTMGLGLLGGFLYKQKGYFDYEKYDEVVVGINSSPSMAEIKQLDSSFQSLAISKSTEIKELAGSEGNKIYDKFNNRYNTESSQVEISYKYIDKTGFWNADTSLPKPTINKNSLSNFTFTPTDYYPDYNVKQQDALATIGKLMANVDSSYRQDKNRLNDELSAYTEQLGKQTSAVKLLINKDIKIDGFNVSIQAPEEVLVGSKKKVDVTYTVMTKDFGAVYPKYRNNDNNIDIVFDGASLKIKNKTKQFQQVKSISMYYGDKILTKSYDLELPPDSVKTLDNFINYTDQEIINKATFDGVNYEIAKRTIINFGFALKYNLVEQNIDKTLYKVVDYKLYDVLKN